MTVLGSASLLENPECENANNLHFSLEKNDNVKKIWKMLKKLKMYEFSENVNISQIFENVYTNLPFLRENQHFRLTKH